MILLLGELPGTGPSFLGIRLQSGCHDLTLGTGGDREAGVFLRGGVRCGRGECDGVRVIAGGGRIVGGGMGGGGGDEGGDFFVVVIVVSVVVVVVVVVSGGGGFEGDGFGTIQTAMRRWPS